jgi:flavin reductase (DIM6/NTAB) family NADH-FMN oxidoreductase RutF
MNFAMESLCPDRRYKLLTSSITPRPIAWVTSQSAAGVRNAAPFSFFNMMSANPPIVTLGLMRRADGSYKDTAANIIATGEFVVNLVAEADAARMNFSCIDAPPEFDELTEGNIATLPSIRVLPPRIASAPISLECRLYQYMDLGSSSTLVLGEILEYHVADRYIDLANMHVDTLGLQLIARMHGTGWYTRSTDRFQMQRPRYADWIRGR